MKVNAKDILKLIISLALTAWVIFVIRDKVDWQKLGNAFYEIEYGWVVLSIGLSLISHWLRGYRWRLLLAAGNHHTDNTTAFLAVMTSYLGNMAFPRLGEVVRCTMLKEQNNIPVSYSLGTVVTDRLMDAFMLGVMTILLLVLDFELLIGFFIEGINDKMPLLAKSWIWLVLTAILGLLLLLWFIRKVKAATDPNSFFFKIGGFFSNILAGIKALNGVKKSPAFWLSTLGIWLLYFLMLYVISFGYEATDEMSPTAGLAVLVMGSLGMVMPVNNGIGAYQVFVAEILVLYDIAYDDGFIFAVVSHGSQTVAVTVIGFICLMILNYRKRKKRLATKQ